MSKGVRCMVRMVQQSTRPVDSRFRCFPVIASYLFHRTSALNPNMLLRIAASTASRCRPAPAPLSRAPLRASRPFDVYILKGAQASMISRQRGGGAQAASRAVHWRLRAAEAASPPGTSGGATPPWERQLEQHVAAQALHAAAASGNLGAVEVLLRLGADPNAMAAAEGGEATGVTAGDWQSPLHSAARAGHEAVVRALLQAGADPNVEVYSLYARYKATPLYAAAGYAGIVAALLEAGAQCCKRGELGRSALHRAVMEGCLGAVHALLAAPNVDLDARDSLGWTPLMCAVEWGGEQRASVVAALVAAGASLALRNREGDTALDLAARKLAADTLEAPDLPQRSLPGVSLECFKELLAAGAPPQTMDSYGLSPLHHMAGVGAAAAVQALLAAGAAAGAKDRRGRTAGELAAAGGHREVAEMLREAAA